MTLLKNILLCSSLVWTTALLAQNDLPLPRNLQAAYDRGTRSNDGRPGKNYWQNAANYDLRIRFDPATRLITGEADIVYSNNSPDTLREMVFKLYPNLYQKGALRLSAIKPADITDGLQITRLVLNGVERTAKDWSAEGTILTLDKVMVLPRQTARLSLTYTYVLNQHSHIRTGEVDSGAWFIAYFFPRIAVYDDVNGWDRHHYLGPQEFYHDYGDFQLAVTVPRGYVVWATGDLTNCAEVLSPPYCQRLAAAEKADGLTTVIDTLDLRTGSITANRPQNTFRFTAKNVPDVAFAISNHYVWQATSLTVDPTTGRRTRVNAVFNPQHLDYYPVLDYARQTVAAMSFRFPRWPFPYAHETIFDGLDQMEYPMMANDNPVEDRAEAIELTDHEIFHTMFPFYVGTNETKFAWMDEGWATLGEWLITAMIDSTIVDEYGLDRYEAAAGTELDLPITTLSTQQSGLALFINAYPKPALGYLYVKDLLGDERFLQGLHHYIRNWNGKHPIPHDFFYSMNAGTGVNLNWFWRRWFFEPGVPDLAIASVTEGTTKLIVIAAKGSKPVPVDLAITFTDGTVRKIHYPIDVWEKGNRTVDIKLTTEKVIKSIQLGSTYVPDVNRLDNAWSGK